jgi:preprotein translocase subunit SecA
MLNALLRTIFGTKHERDVKRMMPTVKAIGALEPALQSLGDTELRAKTDELRARLG